MGWTGMRYNRYMYKNLQHFFQKEVFGEHWQIVESASYNRGRQNYIAAKAPNGYVWGFVIICQFNADYMYFKDMDETMHPYYYDAPERVLKILSPTDNENAKKWRATCWERVERKKQEREANKLPFHKGDLVRIKGGFAHDGLFFITNIGKKSIKAKPIDQSMHYLRIPRIGAKRRVQLIKSKKYITPMYIKFIEEGIIEDIK